LISLVADLAKLCFKKLEMLILVSTFLAFIGLFGKLAIVRCGVRLILE
jgi:hypothetical protein